MTAQVRELLILDGERTAMAFCPPLPENHPRIYHPTPDEKEDGPEATFLGTTACWRGYIGTWEIKDGRFYLVRLRGDFQLRGDEPVFADWFSGVLRIPEGEMLQYVHMGFGTVQEREIHIKIEKGLVVSRKVIDNRDKDHNGWKLSQENLPGNENRFPGDEDL